ncbi:MAG: hypothetical protein IPJ19_16755 [Planctomycetes bacterium]|nr:hypothetical protein [Planctomycetota bacterium]
MILALLASVLIPATPPVANDWIIPAGTTVHYDTAQGAVDARNVIIEAGATLRVDGQRPFRLRATRAIQIDGTLDLSGANAPDVACLACGNLQSPPGLGGPAGDTGGIGNVLTTTWNDKGGDATDAFGNPTIGGIGGDSAFGLPSQELRRPGGGGGGAFGPELALVAPDPNNPLNNGRVARAGFDGSPGANSCVLGLGVQPRGGASAGLVFVDGSNGNDFWGREIDPLTGVVTIGELAAPLAGCAGGAGGNSVSSAVYPPTFAFAPWAVTKGAGGGGGGGLGILSALLVRVGPAGRIVCDGGAGGAGEDSLAGGITRVGGGGGGGSGGMLILQARLIDLRNAQAQSIHALGGAGGRGMNNLFNTTCAGGSGGAGLIQFHVPNPSQLLLPAGMTLYQMTVPLAHVLQQEILP